MVANRSTILRSFVAELYDLQPWPAIIWWQFVPLPGDDAEERDRVLFEPIASVLSASVWFCDSGQSGARNSG
jgi:hypothetical protein